MTAAALPLLKLLASCWYLLAATILVAFLAGQTHTPLSRAILRYGKTRCDGNAAGEYDAGVTVLMRRTMTTPYCHVPKRWFTWFYVVGISCNTLVLLASFMAMQKFGSGIDLDGKEMTSLPPRDNDCGLMGLCVAGVAYQLHLVRRLFECLYVTRFSTSATMHWLHLAFGIVYYMLVPLTLAMQMFACMPNTTKNPLPLASLPRLDIITARQPSEIALLPPPSTFVPLVIMGVSMMGVGGYLQYCCHVILADLRAPARSSGIGMGMGYQKELCVSMSASAVYRIPRGGLFEFVSSPHYLCEIIVYAGLALAAGSHGISSMVMTLRLGAGNKTGSSIDVVSCNILILWGGVLATTCINLYASATETQTWYRAKFGDAYPKHRTALVPWLL